MTMENIFKYDLFIGKNTPELRKELEGLGYWNLPNGYMEWHIPIDECSFLTTDRRGFYKGVMANWNDGHKDCGIDEDMFLELAKVKNMETKFNFNTVPQIWDDYEVLFIFSDDGRVSCRLSFYNDTPQDAVISDLYVHESIRKQGGATAILNWCFECAKDRGCNSVSLRSDNDDWVREWYKRLGFEVESSQVWLKKEI